MMRVLIVSIVLLAKRRAQQELDRILRIKKPRSVLCNCTEVIRDAWKEHAARSMLMDITLLGF